MKRGFLEKLIGRIQRVPSEDVQEYLVDLARERGFLETIFNVLHEGVIVTGEGGRILFINRSACEFFGIEENACAGRPLGEVIRGMDWEGIGGASGDAISRDLEVFYPRNRLLNFYVAALEEDGAVAGHAIILRDITESRKSTEQTIESERFSALTLLAAGVAHEIGNPLNSLGIHLQLLARKAAKLPARARGVFEESIAVARQEVARLDSIITQFLAAVRPQPVLTRPANLNRILEESLAFLKPELRDRDVLLEVNLDPGLPAARLDPDQIKQAFYNLLRNSLQAMQTGGFLRIATRHDESHVYVSFSDTGGGIPAGELQRIFEPYFTTKPGGSGLGLMIVQRIVRAHGGEIALHSAEGRGLDVNIRFPRTDRAMRFLEAGKPPAPESGTPSRRP